MMRELGIVRVDRALLDRRPGALEPLLRVRPVVPLLARHAGPGVSEAGVHVRARGARVAGRGAAFRAHLLRGDGGRDVGLEGLAGGGGARGQGFGFEFGGGFVADQLAGLVLEGRLARWWWVMMGEEEGLTPLEVMGSSRGREGWNSPPFCACASSLRVVDILLWIAS